MLDISRIVNEINKSHSTAFLSKQFQLPIGTIYTQSKNNRLISILNNINIQTTASHCIEIPYFSSWDNRIKSSISRPELKVLALEDVTPNFDVKNIKEGILVFNSDIDYNAVYEIVMLLVVLKLEIYLLNPFSLSNKKLLNNILDQFINKFHTKNETLNYTDITNKKDESISTIEKTTNKNTTENKKNFSFIADIFQKNIDLSYNSNTVKFINAIENIPVLKKLTIEALITKIQDSNPKGQITTDDYKVKYNKILNLVNNIPIDNWLEKDQNIDLQILTKKSIEFVMFSNLGENQLEGDIKKYVNSDEFFLYILLHATSKKVNYSLENFKKFVKETKIDTLLEKPVQFISLLENTIKNIRQEIENNIPHISNSKMLDPIILSERLTTEDVAQIAHKLTRLNPNILTIPDHPLIHREIGKNKKSIKKGYGRNRCPCGSGKKLKDCCGKKKDHEKE